MTDKPFREIFPRLFRLDINRGARVAERGRWRGREWEWEWNWRREPRGRELGELEDLTTYLEGWGPVWNKVDKWVWRLDEINGYSVKKGRVAFLEGRGGDSQGGV